MGGDEIEIPAGSQVEGLAGSCMSVDVRSQAHGGHRVVCSLANF